jgi:hypothetical protein
VINIRPKLSRDEAEDQRGIRDLKTSAAIQANHSEFLAGKTRPANKVFRGRTAGT